MPPKDPLTVLAAIGTLLALAACTPAPAPTVTAETGICNPGAAKRLVGRPRITDGEAKRFTGAGSVRQIEPGQRVIQTTATPVSPSKPIRQPAGSRQRPAAKRTRPTVGTSECAPPALYGATWGAFASGTGWCP